MVQEGEREEELGGNFVKQKRAKGRPLRGEGAGKGNSGGMGLRADGPALQTHDQLRGDQVAKQRGPGRQGREKSSVAGVEVGEKR